MAFETYTALGALNAVIAASGHNRSWVSGQMGRVPNYLNATISRGSVPTASTFALVARVCGYTLALIPSDKEIPDGSIVIEPSE